MNAPAQYTPGPAELAVVLALVRAGTLARAGERLKLDASTVFRTIQKVEKSLGQPLFERSRQGYRATELAHSLATHAERIESELEAVRSAVQQRSGEVSGTVRISTTDTILHRLLLPALRDLARVNPGLELELVASNEFANLVRRDADIAVRATTKPPEHLVGRDLGSLDFALFGPADYQGTTLDQAVEDGIDWIATDEFVPDQSTVQWRRRRLPRIRPRWQMNSINSVCEAIGAGLGVGVVPVFLARLREDMRQIGEPIPECGSRLWLLTHPESRHLRRIAVVAGHIAERVRIQGGSDSTLPEPGRPALARRRI